VIVPRHLEELVQVAVLGSRYLLLLVVLGLAATLLVFAVQFLYLLGAFVLRFPAASKAPVIVAVLDLIDIALIAGLIFTVAISLYDHFIRRVALPADRGRPPWLSNLNAATLKLTLASSIAAIRTPRKTSGCDAV